MKLSNERAHASVKLISEWYLKAHEPLEILRGIEIAHAWVAEEIYLFLKKTREQENL